VKEINAERILRDLIDNRPMTRPKPQHRCNAHRDISRAASPISPAFLVPVICSGAKQMKNAPSKMLATHGLDTAIHLEEGSGISRDNRFTARGLAKVLELFAPHADLLHGHDDGMNKTGTMDGIRTLAGYADTSSHGRVRFVISLTSNDEMRFRLLHAIESGL
jgi:serine-type D-Ala-D-Ala carboxypeptidase/endopeptidase (penicillin-binding protein 4)